MNQKFYLLIIITIIYISCNSTENINYEVFDEFPTTINISCEEIKTIPELYSVGGMLIMDDFIVTVDLKADTFFRLFDSQNYNYLSGFIGRGGGPGEEFFIDPFIQKISVDKFIYKNIASVKTLQFNKERKELNVVEEIVLPTEIMDIWHVFKLNNLLIGYTVSEGTEKEFKGFNPVTKEIFDFGMSFPDVGKKIEPLYKNVIFAKANIVKPDMTKFASAYDKFPILRIFDLNGNIIREIRYNNNQSFPNALINENPSQADVDEVMQNYRMIKSTDQYIYALYIGKKEREIERGLNDFSNEIHIWDWDGNPVKRILLDKKIFTFDVNKEDDYLICCSLESLDRFYKYSLKD